MARLARALGLYLVAGVALGRVLGATSGPRPEAAPPRLPAEIVVAGGKGPFCRKPALKDALRSQAFRWGADSGQGLWRHSLSVTCEDQGAVVALAVFAGARPIFRSTIARVGGEDGDETTAAVAARVLWSSPEVAEAAVEAYLENQPDVARAAADLWRARRWQEAADSLFLALQSDWPPQAQAQLYFGLADSYAHLGRPRQAFWYALAYLALSPAAPPEYWVRSLRGVSGLMAAQPANVEPQAQELARSWSVDSSVGEQERALDDLQRLCQLAPWAEAYALEAAGIYERLGWRPLADIWRRRAALAGRLTDDAALQRRLSELVR